MSRKWIAGIVALAALGGTAVATAAVLGGDDGGPRPAYATVSVDLSDSAPDAAQRAPVKSKKPKLVYLQSPAPIEINPADPPAGVGPFIDVKLTGCSKVIDGGVVPSRTDVYVQGTYVAGPGEYHVLIGIDATSVPDPNSRTPFTISSNLTCLKRVK